MALARKTSGGARKPPGTASQSKQTPLSVFRDVALRLIDKGHGSTLPVAIIAAAFLVLAWRLPQEALGRLPDVAIQLLSQRGVVIGILFTSCLILSSSCVLLLGVIFLGRKIYRHEIERMSGVIREQQLRLDPNRPSSILPQTGTEDEHGLD